MLKLPASFNGFVVVGLDPSDQRLQGLQNLRIREEICFVLIRSLFLGCGKKGLYVRGLHGSRLYSIM
jgi:hypothetical protein